MDGGLTLLLSLFCGAGGLDIGFEQAEFEIGLAFDRNFESIESYNTNRAAPPHGHVADVRLIDIDYLDKKFGDRFMPTGVIGGPPCQSFSQANVNQKLDDPRDELPVVYADLVRKLNERSALDFFVFENVVGLTSLRHRATLEKIITRFNDAGFTVAQSILDAQHYGTPQTRKRVFLVGFNREKFGNLKWAPPPPFEGPVPTVRDAIGGLPEAVFFSRGLNPEDFPHHPNHWCMAPKSAKFKKPGALVADVFNGRSFKTLAWDRPSKAVAYGHREVHIHPSGTRRLSVYEAMRLQGFPTTYRLLGNLSSQITQISEAVPPPLALAIATSIANQLSSVSMRQTNVSLLNITDLHRPDMQLRKPSSPRLKVVTS